MDKDFFTHNRQAIFDVVGADVLVFAGNILVQRSNDASYAFEQEANFWYLTGIDTAGWRLIIQKEKVSLVAPDVDEVHRTFDGSLSNDEAKKTSGVDEVLSYQEAQELLENLKDFEPTVASLGEDPRKGHYDFALNPGPVDVLHELQELFGEVQDCRKALAALRAVKQPEEIDLIRSAITITTEAFELVRNTIHQYSFEYEIEADFTAYFRKKGARGHAYDPIVAAGKNAVTLHYSKNQAPLVPGALVLLDVGARYNGYAADITRTYAHGEVSDRHRAVHLAVETAHHKIIDLLEPGLNVKAYFDKVDRIMLVALNELGILKEKADYRKYFPHSVSHGLGIDVHDSLGGPDEFKPGMILTVEPGIYIPEEGIGVRIEDDILITETGHENLSERLPTGL
ncbi:MAG: putative Xaa-Pro aminopeptidase [Candidatus Saccharibacteria bacterium]|nr:putative Xaa-Pro aminopeptidase [Candidatus Saccharibacteria bacterium]